MGAYRFTVRHVRYWRGAIHKWSTDYVYTGTLSGTLSAGHCELMLDTERPMLYSGAQAVGGSFGCEVYDAIAGGSPLASYTAFDYTVPGDWVPYSGTAWPSAAWDPELAAEPCLIVDWPGGLSRTGKPVFFRKYLHAIPVSQAADPGDPDVTSGSVTSLAAQANLMLGLFSDVGLHLGSVGGRLAGNPVVKNFYGNHQMPRGRRLKRVVTNALPPGDVRIGAIPIEEA